MNTQAVWPWHGEKRACCLYFTMPPPARFVGRRCIDPALKGPNRKAQGNALGIEGDLYESALKGRHRTCSAPSGRSRKRRVGTVPSLVPRALPGAFLFGPFRARNAEAGAQEDRREPQTRSRPTFHQPSVAPHPNPRRQVRSGHNERGGQTSSGWPRTLISRAHPDRLHADGGRRSEHRRGVVETAEPWCDRCGVASVPGSVRNSTAIEVVRVVVARCDGTSTVTGVNRGEIAIGHPVGSVATPVRAKRRPRQGADSAGWAASVINVRPRRAVDTNFRYPLRGELQPSIVPCSFLWDSPEPVSSVREGGSPTIHPAEGPSQDFNPPSLPRQQHPAKTMPETPARGAPSCPPAANRI